MVQLDTQHVLEQWMNGKTNQKQEAAGKTEMDFSFLFSEIKLQTKIEQLKMLWEKRER